jgi:hypothetical protein
MKLLRRRRPNWRADFAVTGYCGTARSCKVAERDKHRAGNNPDLYVARQLAALGQAELLERSVANK